MKFDLQKYLAAPERFTIKNGYDTEFTYLTHTTAPEHGGLIMLRSGSNDVATFELNGSASRFEPTELDLTMEEKPLEIVFEGMAYVSESGAVVGVQVQDNGPHKLSNVSAHKCRVIVTREPEAVTPAFF